MSPTLAIGSILHSNNYQYRIEKVLGQGSFGITYEATPILQGELGALEAEKKVAIKEFFMSDHNIRNGNMVIGNDGDEDNICVYYKHKFLGEALALSKLNHRNIVKVLELFESNGTTYYLHAQSSNSWWGWMSTPTLTVSTSQSTSVSLSSNKLKMGSYYLRYSGGTISLNRSGTTAGLFAETAK